MNKAHTNINWQNSPSTATPLSAANLNAMDQSIDVIDDRVIALDSGKANTDANLSGFTDDSTHRVVSDTEKSTWNGKSTVSFNPIKTTGETIAEITIDGVTQTLKASAGGGGGGAVDSVNGMTGDVVLNMANINDVDINNLADGETLVYDATSGKWVNGSGGGGTSDYTDLTNKPQINGVTLSGNKTSADLGLINSAEVSAIVNVYSAKNLLKYPYTETSKTENGLTFTDNGDGSVTISGVATSGTYFILSRNENIQISEDMILSGCPSGGSFNKYWMSMQILNSDNTYYTDVYDLGNNGLINQYGKKIGLVGITIKENTDLTTPITFYPMIRDARITDDTYVPYAMTNRELTESVDELNNNELGTQVDISNYTNNNFYTCPCDGYIYINFGGVTDTLTVAVEIRGATSSNGMNFGICTNPSTYASYQNNQVFVRKGMRVRILTISQNSGVAFIPLV